MARLGKLPVSIGNEIKASYKDNVLSLVGPKGSLERKIPNSLKIEIEKDYIKVIKADENDNEKLTLALQGSYRAHIKNMVKGVSEGWVKELELVGTGYRAEVKNEDLYLTVGYSHPVIIKGQDQVKFSVEKSVIKILGIDLDKISQIAAKVRDVRPPEPYQGKGIRYKDEFILRKAGKQAAKTTGSA